MVTLEIVDRIYRAFAACPRASEMSACSHCVDSRDVDTLQRVPLRELSCEPLGLYAFKAMTTWGDEADYRHFLPRILELAATDGGGGIPGFDLDLVSRKLLDAGWWTWAPEQRAAVLEYFEAALVEAESSDPESSRWDLEGVRNAVVRLG